jgi:hypothetical protein
MSIKIVGLGLNIELRRWMIIVMLMENWEGLRKLVRI